MSRIVLKCDEDNNILIMHHGENASELAETTSSSVMPPDNTTITIVDQVYGTTPVDNDASTTSIFNDASNNENMNKQCSSPVASPPDSPVASSPDVSHCDYSSMDLISSPRLRYQLLEELKQLGITAKMREEFSEARFHHCLDACDESLKLRFLHLVLPQKQSSGEEIIWKGQPLACEHAAEGESSKVVEQRASEQATTEGESSKIKEQIKFFQNVTKKTLETKITPKIQATEENCIESEPIAVVETTMGESIIIEQVTEKEHVPKEVNAVELKLEQVYLEKYAFAVIEVPGKNAPEERPTLQDTKIAFDQCVENKCLEEGTANSRETSNVADQSNFFQDAIDNILNDEPIPVVDAAIQESIPSEQSVLEEQIADEVHAVDPAFGETSIEKDCVAIIELTVKNASTEFCSSKDKEINSSPGAEEKCLYESDAPYGESPKLADQSMSFHNVIEDTLKDEPIAVTETTILKSISYEEATEKESIPSEETTLEEQIDDEEHAVDPALRKISLEKDYVASIDLTVKDTSKELSSSEDKEINSGPGAEENCVYEGDITDGESSKLADQSTSFQNAIESVLKDEPIAVMEATIQKNISSKEATEKESIPSEQTAVEEQIADQEHAVDPAFGERLLVKDCVAIIKPTLNHASKEFSSSQGKKINSGPSAEEKCVYDGDVNDEESSKLADQSTSFQNVIENILKDEPIAVTETTIQKSISSEEDTEVESIPSEQTAVEEQIADKEHAIDPDFGERLLEKDCVAIIKLMVKDASKKKSSSEGKKINSGPSAEKKCLYEGDVTDGESSKLADQSTSFQNVIENILKDEPTKIQKSLPSEEVTEEEQLVSDRVGREELALERALVENVLEKDCVALLELKEKDAPEEEPSLGDKMAFDQGAEEKLLKEGTDLLQDVIKKTLQDEPMTVVESAIKESIPREDAAEEKQLAAEQAAEAEDDIELVLASQETTPTEQVAQEKKPSKTVLEQPIPSQQVKQVLDSTCFADNAEHLEVERDIVTIKENHSYFFPCGNLTTEEHFTKVELAFSDREKVSDEINAGIKQTCTEQVTTSCCVISYCVIS